MSLIEPPENTASDAIFATSPALGLRLAVISTPRCGNTWLRHLLANVYGLRELAFHSPADIDWAALPNDCILQIHWKPTAAFRLSLEQHGFRVVVLARHPLDVLLSVLHYCLHDGSTKRWLESEGGGEDAICGAMPCSSAFMQYATGSRATALLSVSREWWDLPGACAVRYEDLVADPLGELTRLVEALVIPPRHPLAEAVAVNTLPQLRTRSGTPEVPESDHHFWQGKPGHWKRLLPAHAAYAIAAAHGEVFGDLHYICDPDENLDQGQADAHWIDINRSELMTRLWSYVANRQRLAENLKRVAALEHYCKDLEIALDHRMEVLATVERERAELATALRDASVAIETMSRAPTQRLASMVKRLFRA